MLMIMFIDVWTVELTARSAEHECCRILFELASLTWRELFDLLMKSCRFIEQWRIAIFVICDVSLLRYCRWNVYLKYIFEQILTFSVHNFKLKLTFAALDIIQLHQHLAKFHSNSNNVYLIHSFIELLHS